MPVPVPDIWPKCLLDLIPDILNDLNEVIPEDILLNVKYQLKSAILKKNLLKISAKSTYKGVFFLIAFLK